MISGKFAGVNDPGYRRSGLVAGYVRATTMRSDPAICSINHAPYSGQLRQKPKGSRPPNLLGEKDYCVRAADILAVLGENAHFLKRRAGVKAESFLDPRCLEWQKMKAAAGEQSLELFGCRDTVSALAVIKNPAARDWLVRPRSGGLQTAGAIWRSPFLEFSHFCQIRMKIMIAINLITLNNHVI